MFDRFSFCLAWLTAATLLMGAAQAASGDAMLELRNDHAVYRFDSEAGFGLAEVIHLGTGRRLVHHVDGEAEPMLWRVDLYFPANETHQVVDNRAGGQLSHTLTSDEEGQRLTLNWRRVPVAGGKMSIDVQATVYLPDGDSLARWHITLRPQGPCHVWTADFPLVHGIQDLGDDYLVLPYDWGRIMRDPASRLEDTKLLYPGAMSMQFVTAWGSQAMAQASDRLSPDARSAQGWVRGQADDEAGLYLGTEDSEMWYKAVHMHRQEGASSYGWHFEHYPALPEWPLSAARHGSPYTVPYPVIFGPYAGGVEEAVERYRAWALNQVWASRGPIWDPAPEAAYPVSETVMDTALWTRLAHSPSKVVREVSAYRSALRVPTSLHWYQYTISKFDDNFPEYLPADPYFPQGVRDLHRMGVSVMPYINGMIWDTDTQSYKREDPSRGAARDPEGQTYDWLLQGNNIHVRMNPTYKPWQDKLVEVADKLVRGYGVEGLYLDVLARNRWLDYFSADHRPHGGTYWAQGNRTILDRMQQHVRAAQPDAYLTSEGCGEVYLDKTDAFLLLDIERYGWARGDNWDNYPLYSIAYHDYAVLFGGDAQPQVNPVRTIWQLGLGMTWGAQTMYAGRDMPPIDHSERTRTNGGYLREMVQSYHQVGRKFLLGGKWIPTALVPDLELGGSHPVVVESAEHRVPMLRKGNAEPIDWVGPTVLASSWRAHDGSVGVVLTNVSDRPQKVALRVDAAALGHDAAAVWNLWPLPIARADTVRDGRYEVSWSMPARSVRMIQFGGDKPQAEPLEDIDWLHVEADQHGRFPTPRVDSRNLWSSADSVVQSLSTQGVQELRLVNELGRDAVDRTLATVVKWDGKRDGFGLPRAPSDKPYALLVRTPYEVSGDEPYTLQARGENVLIARLASEGSMDVVGPADALLAARSENGAVHFARQRISLSAGDHMMAAIRLDSLATMDEAIADRLRSLAAGEHDVIPAIAALGRDVSELLSQRAAETLPVEERRTLLETAQAVAALVRVAAGAAVDLHLESDWLAPSLPLPIDLRTKSDRASSVTVEDVAWRLLDPALAKAVEVRPRSGEDGTAPGCELFTRGFDATERLLPLVAQVELVHDGQTFTTFASTHLNIDYPLMVKCEEQMITADESGRASGTFTIKNVSPHPIGARVTVEAPPGWHVSPANSGTGTGPMAVSLGPIEDTMVRFDFRVSPRDRNVTREVKVMVDYAGDSTTRVFDVFKIRVAN